VRFTLIGHACLFVEAQGVTLLVDPWLSGSCYWRSWWHFPSSAAIRPEFLTPDYVYLSHHHFDHFHFPSLRRLHRKAHVLIPKFGVDVMRGEVEGLGFTEVSELPHGKSVQLPGGIRLASFQYGCDDSALVIAADGAVLANLNDCKIKGRAAGAIPRQFGRPTFVFKSHSWAQAYPNCYTAGDPEEAKFLARADYAETFVATVRELRPRYAVPFASMVAFLHPDTLQYNAHTVTPPDVATAFDAAGITDTSLIVMAPGDSWDSTRGFAISPHDPYAERPATLARLAREVEPIIAAAATAEAGRKMEYEVFRRYFSEFLRALPPGAGRLVRKSVVFHVPSSPEPYWVLDVRHRRVRRESALPADWGTLIRIPEGVLADAIAKRIVNFVHISLRVSIELAPGGLQTDFWFWAFLVFYEIGYLPLRRALTPRLLGVWWRRRTEVWQLLTSLRSPGTLTEKMIGTLMTTERGA
jgi:UDP-MurNAc hydroxylase